MTDNEIIKAIERVEILPELRREDGRCDRQQCRRQTEGAGQWLKRNISSGTL